MYCFDKPGVLKDAEDNSSVIPQMDRETYDVLRKEGYIHSGMLPKLENAFKTLESGVKKVRLTSPENPDRGNR